MEFRFRAADPRTYISGCSASNVSYFTEQPVRVPVPVPVPVRYSSPNLGNGYIQNFHPMHEAVQREIEKERIREEIIVAEMARRRVLEEEVRREMMVEREMALHRVGRPGDGVPFFSHFEPRTPILHPLEGRLIEERILFAAGERPSTHGGHRGGGFEHFHFSEM